MAWRAQPPAAPGDLAALAQAAKPLTLPAGYLAFLLATDGGEGDFASPAHSSWLQVWPARGALAANRLLQLHSRFPETFAIGTDGGSGVYALDLRGGPDQRTPLILLPGMHGSWPEAAVIAADWNSFELGFGLEDPASM